MVAKLKITLFLAALQLAGSFSAHAFSRGAAKDVYVVIYATHNGKTGHAGIAVDKYQVKIRDCAHCPGRVQYDTVKTGQLLYFDLWPLNDRFNKEKLYEQVPAQYFRLPASSAEAPITVASLTRKGIPHEEGYPCDGLLKIDTSPAKDRDLIAYLDQLSEQGRLFNAIHFNCADFVELGLEYLLGKNIQADEPVLLVRTTTPNQLYKELVKMAGVTVLKDPGDLVNGSFLKERIIKRR